MRLSAILIALLPILYVSFAVDPGPSFSPEVQVSQHPVVFRPTKHIISSGTNQLRLFINLTSPCDTFSDYLFNVTDDTVDTASNDEQEEIFKRLCTQKYEQSILPVLVNHCPLVDQDRVFDSIKANEVAFEMSRHNQQTGYVQIAKNVLNLVSLLASPGFSVHQVYSKSTYNSNFWKIVVEFENHVRKEQHLHQINDEILSELRTAIDASAADLRQQVDDSLEKMIDAIHFSRFLAETRSQLSIIGIHLASFFENFKSGKVDRKQFNFLFPESGVDKSCVACPDMVQWNAESCQRFTNSSFLLTIETAVIDSSKKIYAIDPFKFEADIDEGDSSMQCLYQYKGPRFVIHDTVRNCTVLHDFEPGREYDTIFAIDARMEAECTANLAEQPALLSATGPNTWERSKCRPSDSPRPFATLQIKSSLEDSYVYCNGLQFVVLYGSALNCKNAIYIIKRNLTMLFVDQTTNKWGVYSALGEVNAPANALDMLHSSEINRLNKIVKFPELSVNGKKVKQFSKIDDLLDQYTTSTQSIDLFSPRSLLRFATNSKNTWAFAVFNSLFVASIGGVITLMCIMIPRKLGSLAIMQRFWRLIAHKGAPENEQNSNGKKRKRVHMSDLI